MTELTIQPTTKFIKAGFIAAAIVAVGSDVAYLALWQAVMPPWVMVIPVFLLLWPATRMVRRRLTRTVVSGDRLRSESGVTTKSTRNIQLTKIQDVRVDQRLLQRFFDVGDLSIETAGEASRLTILNVDRPQSLADEIMNRAQHGAPSA